MAKKHLLKLAKDLFEGEVGQRISIVERGIQEVARSNMVDPEEVEAIVLALRKACYSVSNISLLFTLAAKNPGEFKLGYNSINSLCNFLSNTIKNVNHQLLDGGEIDEASNKLIESCTSQLEKSLPIKLIYEDAKTVKDWPKSKKKEKQWKKQNWGKINESLPCIDNMIRDLEYTEQLLGELNDAV